MKWVILTSSPKYKLVWHSIANDSTSDIVLEHYNYNRFALPYLIIKRDKTHHIAKTNKKKMKLKLTCGPMEFQLATVIKINPKPLFWRISSTKALNHSLIRIGNSIQASARWPNCISLLHIEKAQPWARKNMLKLHLEDGNQRDLRRWRWMRYINLKADQAGMHYLYNAWGFKIWSHLLLLLQFALTRNLSFRIWIMTKSPTFKFLKFLWASAWALYFYFDVCKA